MAGLLLLLLWVLAGVAVAGLISLRLHLEERVLVALVAGLCGSATLTLLVGLLIGLGPLASFLGPVVLAGVALLLALLAGDPRVPWRDSWTEARGRWTGRRLWCFLPIAVAVLLFFAFAFHHALFARPDGSLAAGWENVWSDWSLHSTSATSLAYGAGLPAQSPIYAGTPQLYPFLPDFQSAVLMSVGWSVQAALSVMSAAMATVAGLLVVCLAERLTKSYVAGIVTLSLCVFGAGFEFTGPMTDACSVVLTGEVYPAAAVNAHNADAPTVNLLDRHCSTGYLLQNPLDATTLFVHSLGKLPGVLANQPRAYDTDLDPTNALTDQVQWYTPLLAWWLPQRSFLYGFALTLSTLLLLWIALEEKQQSRWSFGVAGVLTGLLPLFHVHSLFTLLIVLPFAAWHWRARWRDWGVYGAAAVATGLPRLLQLVGGPHGSAEAQTNFPRFSAGWLGLPAPTVGTTTCDSSGCTTAGGSFLGAFTHWLGFWLFNTGVLLPLMLAVGAVALLSWVRVGQLIPRLAFLRDRLQPAVDAVGMPVIRFALPFLAIFVIANLVVFQTWIWDNTKLFLYWQFAAALLVGAFCGVWARRRPWRIPVAAVVVASLVATGLISTARLVPDSRALTVAAGADGAPGFQFASPADVQLADTIRQRTARDAVFLTSEAVTEPSSSLAGRTAVMGFSGWLFSYGIDYSARDADVRVMYAGCAAKTDADCPVFALLHQYHVAYAEIWNDQGVGGLPAPGQAWWQAHYPVMASNDHIVVYDVRGR